MRCWWWENFSKSQWRMNLCNPQTCTELFLWFDTLNICGKCIPAFKKNQTDFKVGVPIFLKHVHKLKVKLKKVQGESDKGRTVEFCFLKTLSYSLCSVTVKGKALRSKTQTDVSCLISPTFTEQLVCKQTTHTLDDATLRLILKSHCKLFFFWDVW